MTKVKICGITRFEDALFSLEAGADALGFVFYKKSKRYIEPKKAKEICEKLKKYNIKTTGVFVNEKAETINEFSFLDYIQMHGFETNEECEKLKKPFIKNIRAIEEIKTYKKATAFLVDAADTKDWGGTGKLSDWVLAREIKNKEKPLVLSGGLNESNILDAINSVNPDWVDVSSSLESRTGIKNHKLIKSFFDKIKDYKEHL